MKRRSFFKGLCGLFLASRAMGSGTPHGDVLEAGEGQGGRLPGPGGGPGQVLIANAEESGLEWRPANSTPTPEQIAEIREISRKRWEDPQRSWLCPSSSGTVLKLSDDSVHFVRYGLYGYEIPGID